MVVVFVHAVLVSECLIELKLGEYVGNTYTYLYGKFGVPWIYGLRPAAN
jgi:hypothetical protein